MTDAIDEERAVLGDELQQRGDPQGELIALMLAASALPATAPQARRNLIERKLAAQLDAHHDAFYGALAPHVTRMSRPDLLDPALLVKRWNAGFADTIWIQRRLAGPDLAEVIRELRTLSIARFVRRLEIGLGDHAAAVAELAREPLPSLRELALGDQTRLVPRLPQSPLATVAELAPLLASLTTVTIQTAVEYAPFASSTLQTLSTFRPWQGEPFGAATTRFRAQLDAIEDLTLGNYLIDRDLFARYPTLRRAVLSSTYEPGFLEHFMLARHDDRLETVSLSGPFREADLEVVVRHAHRQHGLKCLELSGFYAPQAVRDALVARLPPNITLR